MVKSSRVPQIFRSLKLLRGLNVAAMGLSLAGVTGGVFGIMFSEPTFGLASAVPTLVFGCVWAVLLRGRKMVGRSKLRWGWLASIPLAIANSAVACGLLMAMDTWKTDIVQRFFLGGLLGATFGAIFWIPGLLATLAFFGYPILWSQRQADRGLAGEERGEGLVGVSSAVLGGLGLLLTFVALDAYRPHHIERGMLVTLLLVFLSSLGVLAGASAAFLAWMRERRRKQFVQQTEEGKIPGYRVDVVPEGKVLVRVPTSGVGYRVADLEEELLALNEAGEAVAELKRLDLST